MQAPTMAQPPSRSGSLTLDPVSRMFRAGARSMHMGFRPRTQIDAMPSPATFTESAKPHSVSSSTNPSQEFKHMMDLLTTMHSRASGFLRSVAHNAYPYLTSLLPDQPPFDADATASRPTSSDQQPSFFNFLPSLTPFGSRDSSPPRTGTPLPAPEPLLNRFLNRADRLELLYACLLSDLSNMAYEADKVQEAELQRHNLTLVATSGSHFQGPLSQEDTNALLTSTPPPPTPQNPSPTAPIQSSTTLQPKPLNPNSTAAHLSPSKPSSGTSSSSKRRPHLSSMTTCPSPTRLDSLGPTSATFPLPPTPCLPSQPPARQHAPNLAEPNTSAPSAAAAPAPAPDAAPKQASVPPPPPPAAWFSADDPVSKTRYLVIQGSISLDHWAINFKFEPVAFEDPSLGVRVHRGVYEAALHLYDDLLPLVRQHLASSPAALVSLGGHSLGGSIAAVLMLLLVGRGGVRPEQLAPSYSFGAPAVFCAHGAGLGATAAAAAAAAPSLLLPAAPAQQPAAAGGTAELPPSTRLRRSLMEHLCIPEHVLTNVIMHKDIVPRAFICDWGAFRVADFLKSFMPSFKDHWTLSAAHQHKYMYTYIGRVAVLKPDDAAPFVLDDNEHPMLPDEAGLYKLQDAGGPGLPPARAAPPPASTTAAAAAAAPSTLGSALLQFMNYPHPLQSLSKLCSYGSEGAISRYHDPKNYTRGLLRLLD